MPSRPKSFQLAFRFDVARLRADLESALRTAWPGHYNRLHYAAGWTGIALRSVSGDATDLVASRVRRFSDTPLLAACPYFRRVIETFSCPIRSVRLLRLEPGSEIAAHVDQGLGYDFGMVRVHVPILTNTGVRFTIGGHPIPMREGEAWYVDTSFAHAVANHGATDRIHLVLDCGVDDWLRAQFPAPFHRAASVLESLAYEFRAYRYRCLDRLRLLRKDPVEFRRRVARRLRGPQKR